MSDRITLKESVGKAVSYGLSPGTADRIGALAHATKLGNILWHWKYGGESRGSEAERLLTRKAAKRLKVNGLTSEHVILRASCRQVLIEWFMPECRVCLGVGELSGEFKRVVCVACNGTGLKRFHDYERAETIGVAVEIYRKVWDRRFREIRDMVVSHDAWTSAIIREQLR